MKPAPAPSAPAPMVFHFKHEGKDYRCFKAKLHRDAPWYIHFERDGRRYKHCLGTNVKENAITAARQYIDAVTAAQHSGREELLESFKQRRAPEVPTKYATVGQMIAEFERAPLQIGEAHRRQVANNARWALRKVFGEQCAVEALSADQFISAEFVGKFFEAITAELADAAGDQEKARRMQRSANSMFISAKCLLRPKVVKHFERAGLVLPPVDPFHAAFRADRFERVAKAVFNPPGDDIITRTLEAWLTLPRNEFLALGHALAFGLRAHETAQAKWGWHTTIHGQPFLHGHAQVKSGSGLVQVVALDPWFAQMRARIEREGWRGGPEEYILTGSDTERGETVFRDISAWMRGLGWATQKTNHEMRRYAGSQVAMKYGLYQCSTWLRHSSVKVTQEHYTHYLSRFSMIDPEKLAVKWAQAAA